MDNRFDVSVFIINEQNETIYIDEYDEREDGYGYFVMLTNDILNSDYGVDDTILLNKRSSLIYNDIEHPYNATRGWQRDETRLTEIDTYRFDEVTDENRLRYALYHSQSGYKQNIDIRLNAEKMYHEYNKIGIQMNDDGTFETHEIKVNSEMFKEDYIPAAMSAYNQVVQFKGTNIHGYLPSIRQLIIVSKNTNIIHDVFIMLGFEDVKKTFPINDTMDGLNSCWWSSTEYNVSFAFGLDKGCMDIFSKKYNMNYIMALYKI